MMYFNYLLYYDLRILPTVDVEIFILSKYLSIYLFKWIKTKLVFSYISIINTQVSVIILILISFCSQRAL